MHCAKVKEYLKWISLEVYFTLVFFTSIQYSRYSEWNIIILEWNGILNIIKSSGNTDLRIP